MKNYSESICERSQKWVWFRKLMSDQTETTFDTSDIADLGVPQNSEHLLRRVNAVWPKSRWHAITGFTKVLEIYREYTSGDTQTAQFNRYRLGLWFMSPDRVCYCLHKLMCTLGRSRSSINAAFTACNWFVRPLSEEEEWRSALQSAVPHLLLNPFELKFWTIRGIKMASEHTQTRPEYRVSPWNLTQDLIDQPEPEWVPGRVQFPPCQSIDFPYKLEIASSIQ
jgi:hypothetical protein